MIDGSDGSSFMLNVHKQCHECRMTLSVNVKPMDVHLEGNRVALLYLR